jgi:hypothetical protein
MTEPELVVELQAREIDITSEIRACSRHSRAIAV